MQSCGPPGIVFETTALDNICTEAGCSSLLTFIRILTWLLVPGSCPFEPAMDAIWFIFGPYTSALSLACLVYRSQSVIATKR